MELGILILSLTHFFKVKDVNIFLLYMCHCHFLCCLLFVVFASLYEKVMNYLKGSFPAQLAGFLKQPTQRSFTGLSDF